VRISRRTALIGRAAGARRARGGAGAQQGVNLNSEAAGASLKFRRPIRP